MSDKLDQTPGAARGVEPDGGRAAIPNDEDDVEGHQMKARDGESFARSAIPNDEDAFARRMGPGEGAAKRT